MNAKKRTILFVLGCSAAALVLAAVVFILTFDINSYRSRIEAAASGATGLEVRINGKMGLSFFPFGISATDVHVANHGSDIVSLENLKLGADLISLLKRQLQFTSCVVVKPAVTIVKGIDGKYNFETKEQTELVFSLSDLKLSNGTLVYLDKKTGERTEYRDVNLAVEDLSIAGNVIKSASFAGSVDCREVLQKDVRIENLKASVKAVRGIYHFDPLTIGALAYLDRKAGEKTELKEISLAVRDLSVMEPSGRIIKDIEFTGDLDCREIRRGTLAIANVKSPVSVKKGVISLSRLTMDIFGAKAEGNATADKSQIDAVYRINLKVPKVDFETLEKSLGLKKVLGGKGDLHASLAVKERRSRRLMSSMDGTFSLRGDHLVIYTIDLDRFLSSYETSQEFNLVDVGAFFIAGPLSTFAIKGYRYWDLYNQTRGGRGDITQFVSNWKINSGVADAEDCALSTQHNRVALKGKLNLVSERYEGVTVAILDERGCSRIEQEVSGPFGSPTISAAVSAMQTLVGPVIDLFKKAQRLIGKCEVFYNGSVRQPSG